MQFWKPFALCFVTLSLFGCSSSAVGKDKEHAAAASSSAIERVKVHSAEARKKALTEREKQKQDNQELDRDLQGNGQTVTYDLPNLSW